MQVEPIKLTIFLDILGFAEMIKKINNEEDAKDFISKFDVLKIYEKLVNKKTINHSLFAPHELSKLYEIKVLFVSDSIIISYMPKRDFIIQNIQNIQELNAELFILMTLVIAQLQILTIQTFNRFIRGGICDEFSYIQGEHAVGRGITEAYKLESQIAKHPRVIFKKEIVDKYNITKYINDIDAKAFFSLQFYQTLENDEYAHINYLRIFDFFEEDQNNILKPDCQIIKNCADFIVLQKKIIDAELKNVHNEKIYEKYKWLEYSQRESLLKIVANQFFRDYMKSNYPTELNSIMETFIIKNNPKTSFYQKSIFYIKKAFDCIRK